MAIADGNSVLSFVAIAKLGDCGQPLRLNAAESVRSMAFKNFTPDRGGEEKRRHFLLTLTEF